MCLLHVNPFTSEFLAAFSDWWMKGFTTVFWELKLCSFRLQPSVCTGFQAMKALIITIFTLRSPLSANVLMLDISVMPP